MTKLREDLSHVAQLGQPGIIAQMVFWLGFVCFGLVAGLGPRPLDPEHWWNIYLPDWLCLVLCTQTLLDGFKENLKQPAQVTQECDLISKELNLLRTLGNRRLADVETLTRVSSLETYVEKIGLAYYLMGFRISFAFL